MEQKETITEALGIKNDFHEFMVEVVEKNWEQSETVSETIEICAKEVREEEFGEIKENLSIYEKKLVFLGMIIGQKLTSALLAESLGDIFKIED